MTWRSAAGWPTLARKSEGRRGNARAGLSEENAMPRTSWIAAALVGAALLGPNAIQAQTPSRIEAIPLKSRTLSGEEFLLGNAASKEVYFAGELRLPPALPRGSRPWCSCMGPAASAGRPTSGRGS